MKRKSDEITERICDELFTCKENCALIAIKLRVSESTVARIKRALRQAMIADPESFILTNEMRAYFRVSPKVQSQTKAFDKALSDAQQLNQLLEHETRYEALSSGQEAFNQWESEGGSCTQ